MSLKRFYIFALLMVFAFPCMTFITSQAANAQMPGEEEEDDVSLNLVSRGLFAAAIQRVSDGKEGDFNMHYMNMGVVSGCVGVTEPQINLVFSQRKLEISIEEDTEFELRNLERHYGSYSCNIETHTLSFDIRLNRDDLIERNVQTIGLKSKKYGKYTDFKVDINKERIIFEAKYPAAGGYETFWFYPANTVILHTPSAKSAQDVGALIDAFAERNGLVPMKDTLKEFERPVWVKNVKYYTDPSGRILNQIASAERDQQVGTIQPTKTMYGADGPAEQPYDLAVYARKPGLYD